MLNNSTNQLHSQNLILLIKKFQCTYKSLSSERREDWLSIECQITLITLWSPHDPQKGQNHDINMNRTYHKGMSMYLNQFLSRQTTLKIIRGGPKTQISASLQIKQSSLAALHNFPDHETNKHCCFKLLRQIISNTLVSTSKSICSVSFLTAFC